MKKVMLILSVVIILFSSCAKKIDGSSDEAMKSSVEEIKKSLDSEKREKFEQSLKLIMLQTLDFKKIMQTGSAEEAVSDIKTKINGKTADDIIAEGEKIQAEIEIKKKEEAKTEIGELYQKMEQAEKDKKMLEKFEVKRSRFYKRKSGTYYITEEAIIELTVMNGTDKAISKAYFTGTVASPNRSTPWIKDNFNYEISGGLEPGEEVTWYLSPNMFTDWGKVNAPKDAVFTVEVNQLDGANKEQIYSVNNFGKVEQERLEELLSSYPEFKK